ncbi:hypothetical protein LTR56_006354 [Elasticomyces elasticus]|nr:hypothetical protein LTR56_006354 [Elasticomyces elasticus]KAK3663399.1 hypothetical protein LTR22_005809 [Elasticomyces elasticus]KAK4925478.1 hypothetical protein LTR49_007545 [Elasticomyces elasticus]KAK5764573.1 hypothetical protein LTS12_005306 [Elasticomyces elasticus]
MSLQSQQPQSRQPYLPVIERNTRQWLSAVQPTGGQATPPYQTSAQNARVDQRVLSPRDIGLSPHTGVALNRSEALAERHTTQPEGRSPKRSRPHTPSLQDDDERPSKRVRRLSSSPASFEGFGDDSDGGNEVEIEEHSLAPSSTTNLDVSDAGLLPSVLHDADNAVQLSLLQALLISNPQQSQAHTAQRPQANQLQPQRRSQDQPPQAQPLQYAKPQ